MKVLIINPIVYTSESKNIKRVPSIRDSMIYDLCLAFHNAGHDVVLYAADAYKPTEDAEYPFSVIWAKCIAPKIFQPHRMPFLSGIYRYIRRNRGELDLIISGEVFSINSLLAGFASKDKLIVWHELAMHNNLFKKIPSKVWYGFVAKLFMRDVRVVARSEEARAFISKYCANVSSNVIDHGVNLEKFKAGQERRNIFVVCSQLIERKRIDGIIEKFACYLKKYDEDAMLYIAGEGELEASLKAQVKDLRIDGNVCFPGKISHDRLQEILSSAHAMLVNTVKDNSMISIVESIAVGTPVITTSIPLNSRYILSEKLGIVDDNWDEDDMHEIVVHSTLYQSNCMRYRKILSTEHRVEQFLLESRWNQ